MFNDTLLCAPDGRPCNKSQDQWAFRETAAHDPSMFLSTSAHDAAGRDELFINASRMWILYVILAIYFVPLFSCFVVGVYSCCTYVPFPFVRRVNNKKSKYIVGLHGDDVYKCLFCPRIGEGKKTWQKKKRPTAHFGGEYTEKTWLYISQCIANHQKNIPTWTRTAAAADRHRYIDASTTFVCTIYIL